MPQCHKPPMKKTDVNTGKKLLDQCGKDIQYTKHQNSVSQHPRKKQDFTTADRRGRKILAVKVISEWILSSTPFLWEALLRISGLSQQKLDTASALFPQRGQLHLPVTQSFSELFQKGKYQAGQKSCYECSGQSLPEVYRFWVFQFWNTIRNVLENQITSCKPQFCKSSPFWRSLTFSFQKSLDTSMHTYVHTCDCMRVHMWEAEQPSS